VLLPVGATRKHFHAIKYHYRDYYAQF